MHAACTLALKLASERGKFIHVVHLDRVIGHLPSNDHRVVDSLAGGGGLPRCIVAAIEIEGRFRRRARHVKIVIIPHSCFEAAAYKVVVEPGTVQRYLAAVGHAVAQAIAYLMASVRAGRMSVRGVAPLSR